MDSCLLYAVNLRGPGVGEVAGEADGRLSVRLLGAAGVQPGKCVQCCVECEVVGYIADEARGATMELLGVCVWEAVREVCVAWCSVGVC